MGYGNSNLESEYIFHHLPSGKCPSINCSIYICMCSWLQLKHFGTTDASYTNM